MKYVALLRGINVGGNNKVEMARLRALFERLGYTEVVTYINSGNIVFATDEKDHHKLVAAIEAALKTEFNLDLKVVLRSAAEVNAICNELPKEWVNDSTMKCDIMFLWEEVDSADALEQVGLKRDIADVKYVPGAIIWRIDRDKVTRGGADKLIGSRIYKLMTIRNCNTVRKLQQLMS